MDNIYRYEFKNNGDIVLKKIKINFDNYQIQNCLDGSVLLKKNIIIKEIDDLKNYDFGLSSIVKCKIENYNIEKLNYNFILKYIYNNINDGCKIIKSTTLNITTLQKENTGFYYLDNLGISVQGVSSNKCIYEIIKQCIDHSIKIKLKIKLKTNELVSMTF